MPASQYNMYYYTHCTHHRVIRKRHTGKPILNTTFRNHYEYSLSPYDIPLCNSTTDTSYSSVKALLNVNRSLYGRTHGEDDVICRRCISVKLFAVQ